MSVFEFVLAALATYRISLMVVKETGPGKVFKKTREIPSKRSAFYEWLTCIFCFSMTVSALICGVLWWTGVELHFGMWFITWCSLSSITILLNQTFTKGPL